jgi:lipopolysaccharide export system protein LptA
MATYSGNVRLWQQANVVEAPNLSFDRDRRSVEAHASGGKKVTTTLIQLDNKKQPKPLTIVSGTLSYLDASGKVHFGDDVLVRLDEITLTAREMDALRQPDSDKQSSGSPRIGRIVAEGQVNITQPGRRAMGEILTYTSEDEKFVLTGGIPSIFDAERGKITGDSLTFFRRDARVLVEGSTASPAVTQTRVAR